MMYCLGVDSISETASSAPPAGTTTADGAASAAAANSTTAASAHAERVAEVRFRPRARMMQMLGDQLIRSPHIAVFELLKNSHDADAAEATVTLADIEDASSARVVVEDDGEGMTVDTVTGVWLEPGTDFRARQRSSDRCSTRFGRLPLGEKGVGRFAVHKLGTTLELVTRARGSAEVVVSFDWADIEDNEYLADAALAAIERPPEIFVGCTGTRITIGGLRERWIKDMAQDLHRCVAAMQSPFEDATSFNPRLVCDPDPGWFDKMLKCGDVLDTALFHARAVVDPDAWTVSYDYEFTPPLTAGQIPPRRSSVTDVPLGAPNNTPPAERAGIATRHTRQPHPAKPSTAPSTEPHVAQPPTSAGVGPFSVELHIFDLDRDTNALLQPADPRGVSEFLESNGGIRVYRGGVRVYDYGEPGNDWLELDARSTSAPTRRISNRLVVGAVHLDAAASDGLVEKTNREGFVESGAYQRFRSAVQAATQHIAAEHNRDKQTLIKLSQQTRDAADPVTGALRNLREQTQHLDAGVDLAALIDRTGTEYENLRSILLTTAGAGLTMTVMVHEIEKATKALNAALSSEAPRERLVELGQRLSEVVDSLGFIARRSDRTTEKASELVSVSLRSIDYRFANHKIEVRNGFNDHNDFPVTAQRRLIVGTLLNLYDNSICWLNTHNPDTKRLYVAPTRDLGDTPGILVADNGPGFTDPPDLLTQPFMTRRTDGMGLGLYIANEVMHAHGGRLVFPASGAVGLPPEYDGACVAVMFDHS